jgi:hypothetical protein
MGLLDTIQQAIGIKPAASSQVTIPQNKINIPYKEQTVKFIKDEFVRRQKERKGVELQWNLNMNFLMGNQFCDINPTANMIQQVGKLYDWEERVPYNLIASIHETRLAKLKNIRPAPHTRPLKSETRSVARAKISNAVLEGLDQIQNAQEKIALATAWAEITGCCFYKQVWNTDKGRMLGNLNGANIFEGDIDIEVVSPFEIYPDSNFSKGVEGCKSIIHARAYSVKDIWDRWGIKVDGKKVDVFNLQQPVIGTGGLGYDATVNKYSTTAVEGHEVVIEYMELPTAQYPNGRIIVVAGNEILDYGDFAYKVDENGAPGFNLTMQVCIETPGYFWPTSIVERLIPVQRAYNAVKNRKHEVLNRKAIGNIAVEDDGNVDVEDLEAEGLYPGKVHLYARGGQPPQFLESHASTNDFEQEEKDLLDLFYKIAGVSPFATESTPPTGVNSGIAMEKISESDNQRIALTAENINIAAIKRYKISLRMYRQFASGPRIVRYVGKNEEIEVLEWFASDLDSDDIVIEKEDSLASTPAQRKQMVLDLLQYKLFSTDVDPRVRSKVINLLELGNWEATDDIEELHTIKAHRENKLIMEGQMPQYRDFDMHSIHIQEHNRFRLDVEYEQWEMQNPQLAMVFDQHVKMHQQAEMMATQNMIMQQQAAQPPKQ